MQMVRFSSIPTNHNETPYTGGSSLSLARLGAGGHASWLELRCVGRATGLSYSVNYYIMRNIRGGPGGT